MSNESFAFQSTFALLPSLNPYLDLLSLSKAQCDMGTMQESFQVDRVTLQSTQTTLKNIKFIYAKYNAEQFSI